MSAGDGKPWTPERDDVLKRMFRRGDSVRVIGLALGISHIPVRARIAELNLERAEIGEVVPRPASPPGGHLRSYKLARRGFHVPLHLEKAYVELLKTGISIEEACSRLGISTETRGGR